MRKSIRAKKRNVSNFVVFGMAFVSPAVVTAQAFESRLTTGKGVPVCEAYVAAKNKVRDSVVSACEIGRQFEGSQISRPSFPMRYLNLTWVAGSDPSNVELSESTIQRNLEFFRSQIKPFAIANDARLARYYNYQYSDEFGWRSDDADWKGTPEQLRIASLSLDSRLENALAVHTLPIVHVDIDNDGVPDPIFFFLREDASWTPRAVEVPLGAPIILAPDLSEIDAVRTLAILRRPVPYDTSATWKEVPRLRRRMSVGDFLTDSEYAFFRYKGLNYFEFSFRWDGLESIPPVEADVNVTRVYLSNHGKTRAICEIACVQTDATNPSNSQRR